MNVTWTVLKNFVDSRIITLQWIDIGEGYALKAFDGYFELSCDITKDGGSDVIAFEANYKKNYTAVIPSTIVQVTPAVGSKYIYVNGAKKNLFARNTGKQFSLAVGANDLFYTASFPWVKMIGLECIGASSLDYAELKIYDTPTGTYSGVPNLLLNQFGYTLNITPGFYSKESPFDADIYVGMILKITYFSVDVKTIGINYVMNEVK